jgi:adenosine deaminase
MTDLAEFIRGMPKAELHLHIEGTLEPEMRFRLAERNGITLPFADAAQLRQSYSFDSLTSFLVTYYDAMNVLRTADDFYDLALAYLVRAHQDNVRYAEIFFDPQAHTGRGVAFDTVIRGLRRAVIEARRRFGLRAQLIMCFVRDLDPRFAMATLVQSLPYKEWIIGVGLDSDERGNPPVKFAEVFARARAEGYQLTMHCDVDQENSTEHIRQCLEAIGVDRIDHGVNILESGELSSALIERGLGLTVCPVSNRWVTGDLKAAELKQMLEMGIRATVNSDDPAYFNAYVADNLVTAQREAALSAQEVAQLERNALTIAWLPGPVRDELLAEVDQYASDALATA